MAKIAQLKPKPSALQLLQQEFCLAKLGGEVWVVETPVAAPGRSGTGSTELQFFRINAARLLISRFLEALPIPSVTKEVYNQFLISPNTTVYDSLAFSPLPTAPTTLNLWRGCPITPSPGDWLIIRRYLLEIICAGDMCAYRFLILFLAHMIQKPEVKPGIMVVLLGGQGIGKGGFFRLLSAIWPETTLLVSDISHILGQFNAQLERSYALCMDEALFVGDKRATDRLKSFVTEPTITIEQKYQPRRTIESFHRIFAASNHAHFAQVDSDDRRFLFLRVSETRKSDFNFWKQFHAAIGDPAILAAIVHDLKTYDIGDFNPRERPKTASHIDQKVRSLSGFDRFWNEVLQAGMIDNSDLLAGPLPWETDTFVSTRHLMRAWLAYESRGRSQFIAPQEREMREALAYLCPSATQSRKMAVGCQQRGYNLPPLPLARAEFAKFLGGDTEWND